MPAHAEQLLHHLRRLVTPAALGTETDAALLNRFVRHQDDLAFTTLVQRHRTLVLGVCRRLLRNLPDAEDAAQATFLVLARKAASLTGTSSLAAFLHGVARHLALKCLRANSRRRQREARSMQTAACTPDPLDELTARELLVILDEELERLPEAYRLPLILCCLEGRTQEEAARQLGWTTGSVRGRLERGRARLHARLVRRGLTLPAALLAVEAARGAATASLALGPTAIQAILAFASRAGAAGEGLSAQAVALAQGGLQSVAITKLKVGLGLLLLMGVMAVGIGGKEPAAPAPRVPEAERTPRTDAARPASADLHGDPLPPGAVARMGTVRFRQGGMLAFLPDGKTLLSGGFGNWNTVRLWQVPSGKELRPLLKAKQGLVYSTALSPDGKTLATGLSEDGRWEVSLSEVATGKELRRLRGLNTSPDVLAFAPDGKVLAVGVSGNVYLHEMATGKLLRRLDTPDLLRALAFSPDGRVLAAGGYNGRLSLWDMATDRKPRVLRSGDPSDIIYTIAFSPDGKRMVSGGQDATIRVWDTATRKPIRKLTGRRGAVHSLVISPDGKTLFSGAHDGSITRWKMETYEELRPLEGHQGPVRSLTFSRDGKLLASESADFTIRLWDPVSGKERTHTEGHQGQVHSVAFSPDGKTVASGGYHDRMLRLWDAATGRELRCFTGHQDGVLSVAFAPDCKTVASGGAEKDSTIRLWNVATGRELHQWKGSGRIERLAFSPNGRLLACLSWSRGIRLWDVATGREVRWLRPQQPCQGLAFSPDGKLLASCSLRQICLTDVATGRELRRFGPVYRNTSLLAFSPDGLTLATGSDGVWPEHEGKGSGGAGAARPPEPDYSRTLCLWDVATGREIRCLKGPREHIRSIAFAPDGRTLATGTNDGHIYLWEMLTGLERGRLIGHQNTVSALAFAPDGWRLVSGSYDTTLLVWGMPAATNREDSLTPAQLDRLWQALAAADAGAAYRALQTLAQHGRQTVPFLEERLRKESPPGVGAIAALVADLDSDTFAVREKATRQLEKLGKQAEPALRRALQGQPSPEVRHRVGRLLRRRAGSAPSSMTHRLVRAVEALEVIGSPEARRALQRLAERKPESRLTEEARAALARLTR